MRLKHVSASHGADWVKQGFRTFTRQPLAISGLFFMFMAGLSLMSIVPFLGSVAAIVITPAATLGLMAASRDATHGKFPMPATLLTAFRQSGERSRAMLILGGIYGACLLLLVAVAMGLGPDVPDEAAKTGLTPELIAAVMGSPGLWLSLMLYVPVLMMFWHAPALVHWHGVAPVKSLFFSLLACWNNRGAMVLYLISWFALMLVAALVVSTVASALGGTTMSFIIYPLVLMFASVFYASLFFTFKDSFDFDEEPSEPVD